MDRKQLFVAVAVVCAGFFWNGAGPAAQVEPKDKKVHHKPHKVRKAPWRLPAVPSAPLVRLASRPAAPQVAGAAEAVDPIDLKLLVVSADGSESDLPAIKQVLEFAGIPYTVYIAAQTPGGLTADKLFEGGHAYYQGVILCTGDLGYFDGTDYVSALTATEWQTLWNFEAKFQLRQVSWYAYPTPELGFTGTVRERDTGASPLSVTYAPAGASVFSYANTAAALKIRDSWTYLAKAATDGLTDTLLKDGSGNALGIVRRYADGRQNLVLTFDSNQYQTHALVLGYGLVRWVTKGLFLGERHVYASAQVDDLFLDADLYNQPNVFYRMNGNDFRAIVNWQNAKQAVANTANFRLDWAFNEYGASADWTYPAPDTLTPEVKNSQAKFKFINHTYDHTFMDDMSYAQAATEVTENVAGAQRLGLTHFDARNLVTPEISGLHNPHVMQALWDNGVRFVVSDTSIPGQGNPSPNTGLANWLQPGILMLPRRPTNLFYNVSKPAEWTQEYNDIYRAEWGRDLTYAEILDFEAEVLLAYLLKGDCDPWMFHQANARAYSGSRSLLSDLLDKLFAKYNALLKVPLTSPTMNELADVMARRAAYNASGVTAQIVPSEPGKPGSITLTAPRDVVVPVTGLNTGTTATTSTEVYGGDTISYIRLTANQPATFALP